MRYEKIKGGSLRNLAEFKLEELGDLGPVANPSRQVKYLAIRFARYSSYSLDELRLLTIGLYAGLTPTIPEPVEADGTTEGSIDSVEPTPEIQSWFDTAQEIVESILAKWLELWPRLHLMVSFTTSENGLAIIHVSIDLLGDLQTEEADFDSPIFDLLDEDEMNLWAQQVDQDITENGAVENNLRSITTGCLTIIHESSALLPAAFVAGGLPGVAFVLGIAVVAWTVWMGSLFTSLGLGYVSLNYVFGLIGIWGLKFWNVDGGYFLSVFVKSGIWTIFSHIIIKAANKWVTLATWMIFTILSVVVEFAMFAYTYYLFCTLWEYSILNYLDGVST